MFKNIDPLVSREYSSKEASISEPPLYSYKLFIALFYAINLILIGAPVVCEEPKTCQYFLRVAIYS